MSINVATGETVSTGIPSSSKPNLPASDGTMLVTHCYETGEIAYLVGKNNAACWRTGLDQCQLCHHKSSKTCPGISPRQSCDKIATNLPGSGSAKKVQKCVQQRLMAEPTQYTGST
jgi:hypothetical protein